jgi:hypothetical protein
MSDRIIQRNDTAANWETINPILAMGELGIVIDGAKGYKIGDGVTPWNNLPYPANPSNIVQTTGNSETAVMSQKCVTEKMTELELYDINIASRGFYLDKNHLVGVDGNVISYDDSTLYDCIWIKLQDNATKIEIQGAVITRFLWLANLPIIQENYISNNTTGVVVDGAKWVIVNLKKSNNLDGYANTVVNQIVDETKSQPIRTMNKIASRGGFFDKNHIIDFPGDGSYSYSESITFDCVWVSIPSNVQGVNIIGAKVTRYCYFSEYNTDSYIGNNTTGVVIDGAKLVIVNIRKTDNIEDYESSIGVSFTYKEYVSKNEFAPIREKIISIPTGKNLIDAENLLYGYSLSSGVLYETSNGIMSNLIELEHGKTYTMQGIIYYGTGNNIFIARYDEKGNYLDRIYYSAIIDGDSKYGSATFTYDNCNGLVKYIRIVLQSIGTGKFDKDIAQIAEGTDVTDFSAFEGERQLMKPVESRKLRVLSIGNSYSHDALDYVPFLLKSIAPEIDLTLGILYLSGATLQTHYNNWISENATYRLSMYNGGTQWQKETFDRTIQSALDEFEWDVIILQQGSTSSWEWSTYQPYLNNLISLVSARVAYPIKFGWMLTQSRPRVDDNRVYDDETIVAHYNNIAINSQKVINETLCDFILPVGTAVQNARTTSLDSVGDYGKLCAADGGHLQEGLPVQLAGYTCVLTLLQTLGIMKSVIGEQTIVDEAWRVTRATPSPNGTATGSNKENCLIAQKCAVMAVKKPYEITDMSTIL